MATSDAASIARSYVEAVGAHSLEPLKEILDDELVASFFGGPYDKAAWITALDRLLPALIRNDIREIFAAGDRTCIVYDFVTNTDAGAVRCVELLTINNGKIVEIELILDRAAFAPVNKKLDEQAAHDM